MTDVLPLLTYFWLSGSSWLSWLFPGCSEQGLLSSFSGLLIALASLAGEHRLSGAQASVVVALRLQRIGSVVVAHGLRCSKASGIFLDQGWHSCLLHWQVGSLPLSHQGSLTVFISVLKLGL